MNTSKVLVFIGFTFAIIGWCLGAFFDLRQIGGGLFLLGFFTAACGVVGAQFSMKTEGKLRASGIGMKVGAVGFGICCLSGLIAIVSGKEDVANYIFFIGFIVALIGIIIIALNAKSSANSS